MLHHFPHQVGDSWHAVYRVPGRDLLSSVGVASTKAGAQHMCDEGNNDQQAKERISAQSAVHPADRKIPGGFYTDGDAQGRLF